MNVREWALITFTILAQMSVGSFLVLQVVYWFAKRKAGEEQADEMSDRALLAIFPVLLLGMAASLLHLGNPLNAYKAIGNVGSSWLSREITCGVAFAAVGGLYAIMQWRKLASASLRNLVALAAAVIGLVLVVVMSMVYMIPTRPSWNVVTTPISFVITALLLGVLAMSAAFVANYWYVRQKSPKCADTQCELLRGSLRGLALASIVLLGLEFLVLPLGLALEASGGAAPSVSLLAGEYGILFALRLALVFLGAGVLGIFVYQTAQKAGQERAMGNLAYVAFALVLVGEVLGRFLFYAAITPFGLQ